MVELFTPENMIALLTLLVLEIVLGIDNVIFIAILSSKLPEEEQPRARNLGIGLAVVSRIVLLFAIGWVMSLTTDLFNFFGNGLSGRDLILLIGGMFLIGKSTFEIHEKLVDIVFSLDSVITAVGISGNMWVMVPAVLIAAAVMLIFAGSISRFVEKHPTMKILALAFLIMIGSLLVMEGWNHDLVKDYKLKNYIYFAMAFSFLLELINMRMRKNSQPVQLHNQPHLGDAQGAPQVTEAKVRSEAPKGKRRSKKSRR